MRKFILFICFLFIPINVFAIDIDSKSGIVYNRNNDEILFEKNINDRLPIASLTKIITTIVAIENIDNLDDTVMIDSDDLNFSRDYTNLELKVGDVISYRDLLYGTIMKSAADSSLALANNVFDDYDKFINKMNELVSKLKLNNSHFSNPIGKDEDNYSSSYDLLVILDYALDNPLFRQVYTTKNYKIVNLDKEISNNINEVIEKENIINNGIKYLGTKTGFTTMSGLSLSGLSNINNNEIICVTLGASGEYKNYQHLKDNVSLLDYVKDNYSNRLVLEKDKLIDNINYNKRDKSYQYKVLSKDNHYYYLSNDFDINYLKVYYNGVVNIDSKSIKEGEKLGSIDVYYYDKKIVSEDVLFSKSNIVRSRFKYESVLVIAVIAIIGLFIFRKDKHKKN